MRVERAVHLLRTGNSSVDRIAAEIGYSDGVTLRTLLRRKLGRGVRELLATGESPSAIPFVKDERSGQ
jgi:transcriptional regulator GlxA family with amidase domain